MKVKSKVDLAIITEVSMPIGMAPTNRILSYAKVISRFKNVKIYIPRPTEFDKIIQNKEIAGKIDALSYQYTTNSTRWPRERSVLYKIYVLVSGIYRLIKSMFEDRPKTVIIYTGNTIIRYIFVLLKFRLNFKLIIEENEFPKYFKNVKSKLIRRICLGAYSKADGMLVMTNELANYYSGMNAKSIFVLPMTVDVTRFDDIPEMTDDLNNYFVYVGGGGGFDRDGVLDIVKGFEIFCRSVKEFKLVIVGPQTHNEELKQIIDEFIDENGIKDKVVFLGIRPSSQIPAILVNSTGIVMAPNKNFPSGGFPTKLGEFLMSGKPVILTNVSEISSFLNENNSYLVEPGNTVQIADSMIDIVSDNAKSIEIGKNGKKTAQNYFNAETYRQEFLNFLKI
jgi:glycosyltransferase involved in cell wall biosynthesis